MNWFNRLKIAAHDTRIAALAVKYRVSPDFVQSLVQYDVSGRGTFLEWLVKQAAARKLRFPEDGGKVIERLQQFTKLKNSPKFAPQNVKNPKDINSYGTYGDLASTIDASLGNVSKQEAGRTQSKAGQEVVVNKPPYQVVKITTPEASAELCKGTEWCVKDPQFFDEYKMGPKSPAYLFLRDGQKVALLHGDSGQFMDLYDRPVDPQVGRELLDLLRGEVDVGACLAKLIRGQSNFEGMLRPGDEKMPEVERSLVMNRACEGPAGVTAVIERFTQYNNVDFWLEVFEKLELLTQASYPDEPNFRMLSPLIGLINTPGTPAYEAWEKYLINEFQKKVSRSQLPAVLETFQSIMGVLDRVRFRVPALAKQTLSQLVYERLVGYVNESSVHGGKSFELAARAGLINRHEAAVLADRVIPTLLEGNRAYYVSSWTKGIADALGPGSPQIGQIKQQWTSAFRTAVMSNDVGAIQMLLGLLQSRSGTGEAFPAGIDDNFRSKMMHMMETAIIHARLYGRMPEPDLNGLQQGKPMTDAPTPQPPQSAGGNEMNMQTTATVNWFDRMLRKLAARSTQEYGYWIDPKAKPVPVEQTGYDANWDETNAGNNHIGTAVRMGWGNSYPEVMTKGYIRLVTDPNNGGWGIECETWPTKEQAMAILPYFTPNLRQAQKEHKTLNVQVPGYSITLIDLTALPDILLRRKIPRGRDAALVHPMSIEQRYPNYKPTPPANMQVGKV